MAVFEVRVDHVEIGTVNHMATAINRALDAVAQTEIAAVKAMISR